MPDDRPTDRAVLQAAAEVFAERGLGATLAEIADRAGVGVASVYRRFTSKDELITKVYEPRIIAAQSAVESALENPDAWAAFEGYFRNSLREVVEDRGFRELTLGVYSGSVGWSRSGSPDRLLETIDRTEQAMRPRHVELVRRAQAAGDLRADLVPPDMLLLTMAALSTADFAGGVFPGLPDRVATVILDGLRSGRAERTTLPPSAMDETSLQPDRTGRSGPGVRDFRP